MFFNTLAKFKNQRKIFQIINLSPESLFQGSLDASPNLVHYIDCGALSTRPGSSLISIEEEINRFEKFFLDYNLNFELSLDIYRYPVLKKVIDLSTKISYINNVAALDDIRILDFLESYPQIKMILMHSATGIPPKYFSSQIPDDFYSRGLLEEYKNFLDKILYLHKIPSDRFIFDPGLGFGKNFRHSLDLVEILPAIKKEFGVKILLGASRKSFLMDWFKASPDASLTRVYNSQISSEIFLDLLTFKYHSLFDDSIDALRVHNPELSVHGSNLQLLLQ